MPGRGPGLSGWMGEAIVLRDLGGCVLLRHVFCEKRSTPGRANDGRTAWNLNTGGVGITVPRVRIPPINVASEKIYICIMVFLKIAREPQFTNGHCQAVKAYFLPRSVPPIHTSTHFRVPRIPRFYCPQKPRASAWPTAKIPFHTTCCGTSRGRKITSTALWIIADGEAEKKNITSSRGHYAVTFPCLVIRCCGPAEPAELHQSQSARTICRELGSS